MLDKRPVLENGLRAETQCIVRHTGRTFLTHKTVWQIRASGVYNAGLFYPARELYTYTLSPTLYPLIEDISSSSVASVPLARRNGV